jgi:chromosomal replication initiator protein
MTQAVVTSNRVERAELQTEASSSTSLNLFSLQATANLNQSPLTVESLERDQEFAAQLLLAVGDSAYSMWFGPDARFVRSERELSIEVNSDFVADCIRKFCMNEVDQACTAVYGEDVQARVRSKVAVNQQQRTAMREQGEGNKNHLATSKSQISNLKSESSSTSKQQELRTSNQELRTKNQEPSSPASLIPPTCSPKFFVGKSNRLAAAAVDLVVDRPGELGVLYVYGPNGVGKTHLCKSIRERLRARHGMRRLIYMTAEQFTIDFSESTRGAGFAAFRKKYRDVDGLIIDDVGFFLSGNKHSTLAELRNTVDDLLNRKRQIVMTADRPLSDLSTMGNDLMARLSGGVLCCLDMLDVELRRQLLADICHRHQVNLHDSTIQSLADRAIGDGRSLYGLVFRLLTQQRITGGKLTHDQAMGCTLDLFQASQTIVRLADIERVVCDSFGLDANALKAKSRCKNVTAARMLAMYLARKHTSSAFSEIGQHFGNRQHSTVISAQRRVESWLAQDEPVLHPSGNLRVRDLIKNVETSLRVG